MVTLAQGRAFRTGTLAALERDKERVTSIVEIIHSPKVRGQQLLQMFDHALETSGVVSMAQTSVRLSEGNAETRAALQSSEKMRDHYRALYEQTQEKLDTLLQLTGDTREWITLTALAKRLGVCYTTVWRAHRTGRLVTKRTGGVKKDLLLCDPPTYVSALGSAGKRQ